MAPQHPVISLLPTKPCTGHWSCSLFKYPHGGSTVSCLWLLCVQHDGQTTAAFHSMLSASVRVGQTAVPHSFGMIFYSTPHGRVWYAHWLLKCHRFEFDCSPPPPAGRGSMPACGATDQYLTGSVSLMQYLATDYWAPCPVRFLPSSLCLCHAKYHTWSWAKQEIPSPSTGPILTVTTATPSRAAVDARVWTALRLTGRDYNYKG